jgi:hypothetical protein
MKLLVVLTSGKIVSDVSTLKMIGNSTSPKAIMIASIHWQKVITRLIWNGSIKGDLKDGQMPNEDIKASVIFMLGN